MRSAQLFNSVAMFFKAMMNQDLISWLCTQICSKGIPEILCQIQSCDALMTFQRCEDGGEGFVALLSLPEETWYLWSSCITYV